MSMFALPKISCICPTFARVRLLEEALHSFLLQEYLGEKELVICNDFTTQRLKFDHPEVKVVNLPHRCANLGAKRNATAAYATGDLMLTWGDDDLALPHRIQRMAAAFAVYGSPMVKEGWFYTIYGGKVYLKQSATTGAHIIDRGAYWACGGIPQKNSGEDVAFNDLIADRYNLRPLPVAGMHPAFIYRFSGTERLHISSMGEDKADRKTGYERMLEQATALVKDGKEPEGDVALQPCWRQDYAAMMQEAIPQ